MIENKKWSALSTKNDKKAKTVDWGKIMQEKEIWVEQSMRNYMADTYSRPSVHPSIHPSF